MKNKRYKLVIFSLLMMLCLCEIKPALVWAETKASESKSANAISISSAEDLMILAKNCSLDAYSIGKTVELQGNLDLSGIDFPGIPYFNGTFLGNGYTISGLTIKGIGSQLGLFRYVGELGKVKELHIKGTILPTGSQMDIGGVAGVNYGTIENCSFAGTICGQENVGGIVGTNKLFGQILNCSSNALILATNRTGGIAGVNEGIIEECLNRSKINIEELEPVLEIEGMNMGDLNIAQTLITRNNTGGIAGKSNGVITNSENYGEIGYNHTGYNVGGIAGYQSGIISECKNHGEVYGRKDVGGIVGQAAPYIQSEYLNEKAQQLKNSMNRMERTMKHLEKTMESLPADMGITKDEEGKLNIEWKDYETLAATLKERKDSVENDMNSLVSQMNSLNNQVNHLADEMEEVPIEDISSVKNAAKLDGVVSKCLNYGDIFGDLNVGGIAGTMNIESTDDPELDREIELDIATKTELNDVIIACLNYGDISGKKNCIGAISGLQELGLIYNCEGYSSVKASAGNYVGGIAGQSNATIEKSYSVSDLSGKNYIGGIAGFGATIKDCLTMVTIDSEGECLGSVAGDYEDGEIENNYFVKDNYDGIDNISYADMAEPISYESIMEREDVPAGFHQVTVTYVAEGEIIDEKRVPYGYTMQAEELPELKDRADAYVVWPEQESYANITTNIIIEAIYTPWVQSIASKEQLTDGRPVAIITDKFYEGTALQLKPVEAEIVLKENSQVLYAYEFDILSDIEKEYTTLEGHFYVPKTEEIVELWLKIDGNYVQTDYVVDGNYVVANIPYGAAFAIVEVPVDNSMLYTTIAVGAGVFLLVILCIIVHNKRKKKVKK